MSRTQKCNHEGTKARRHEEENSETQRAHPSIMNESPTSERAEHRRLLGSIRPSLSVARVCVDADRFGRTEALRVFVSSRQVWCAATCVLALLGPAIPAHADVSAFLDKPIAAVRVVVEGRDTTDSTVIQLIETQA